MPHKKVVVAAALSLAVVGMTAAVVYFAGAAKSPHNEQALSGEDRGIDANDDATASGLSSGVAASAAESLDRYVSGAGFHDIARLASLAEAHGAEVEPMLLETVQKMLAVMPDHAKPAGSSEWSDIDVLRNTQYKSKYRVWDEIDADRVEVVRFQGADVLVSEIKFYRIGPQPGGGYASIHAVPFRVRDLERRLQQGEAAGAVVTFPVTDDHGAKQVISVLLGEYAPGKWYPVRHRTVSSKPRS